MRIQTIKIDICDLGEFSSFALAQYCLNLKFNALCVLHCSNYQVKCLIAGRENFIEYTYKESKKALSFEVTLEPDGDEPDNKSGD